MPALHVDLTGLEADYAVLDPGRRRGRSRRRYRGVLLGLLLVACLVAAWWGGGEAVARVLSGAALVWLGTWWAGSPRTCARTRLSPEVLEVKDGGLGRGDRYAWWFVREVTCRPGRRVPGRAVLCDGRTFRLHGMPADDVGRLARALADARRGAATDG